MILEESPDIKLINKKHQGITTCHWLDLETLGFRPVMPTHVPGHWSEAYEGFGRNMDTVMTIRKQTYYGHVYITYTIMIIDNRLKIACDNQVGRCSIGYVTKR